MPLVVLLALSDVGVLFLYICYLFAHFFYLLLQICQTLLFNTKLPLFLDLLLEFLVISGQQLLVPHYFVLHLLQLQQFFLQDLVPLGIVLLYFGDAGILFLLQSLVNTH